MARSIGLFIDLCRELDAQAYCHRYPHPVLLHAAADRPLQPPRDHESHTIERMVLSGKSGELPTATRACDTATPDQLYGVFLLSARDPVSPTISLGCSRDCDVQIDDGCVSKVHAIVDRKARAFAIRDNDSTAGTQVNDKVLASGEWRELASGDRVTLGYVDLTFLLAPDFYRFVRTLFID
jgi:hypothetical protein